MRKTLIALIILTLSIGVVGCTSDKEETASNSNEVVTQEESKEEKKRSSDEMYELYASKVEEVEKLFKENNIDYKEKNDNDKYDGKTSISYENSSEKTVNELTIARYGIAFDNDGEVLYISAKMNLNINEEEMKAKEFKFEDTELFKLTTILIPDINSEEEINEKINNYYKNGGKSVEVIDIENGKVMQSISLTNSYIDYIIKINP